MTVTDPSLDAWNELVRAGEVPPVSEATLLGARVAVRRAATTETLPARVAQLRRRRRLRYAIALGATASIVAAGAVTVQLGDHEVGGSPAAAAVLERAAQVALAQHEPIVRPGQYLKVTLVQETWGQSFGQNGTVLTGKDGKPATITEHWTRSIWIPHDIDAEWTWREHTRNSFGTTDPRYHDPSSRGREGTYRTPSWARSGDSHLETYDPDWYSSLPRDPEAMLRAIRASVGGEGSGPAYDFAEIYSEVLRSPLAPAAVKSAVFSALAKTPGMKVEGDVTAPDGRPGIAIGAGAFQMVFDATSGAYVAERGVDPGLMGHGGLDGRGSTLLSSVTTTVVDHAPCASKCHGDRTRHG